MQTALHQFAAKLQEWLITRLCKSERLRTAWFPYAQASSSAELQAFFQSLDFVDPGIPLVRIGAGGDGGYLLPDDFAEVEACFSPGVGPSAQFELELAFRGIRSFLIDGSISACPVDHESLHFESLYLGLTNDATTTTLHDWMLHSLTTDKDLILQMDIEGHEWAVLLDADQDLLSRFRIIVLELHGLEAMQTSAGLRLVSATIRHLQKHFVIVHAHANNCVEPTEFKGFQIPRVLELTLLRRDRVRSFGRVSSLPHPLDRPNVAQRAEISLRSHWYISSDSVQHGKTG